MDYLRVEQLKNTKLAILASVVIYLIGLLLFIWIINCEWVQNSRAINSFIAYFPTSFWIFIAQFVISFPLFIVAKRYLDHINRVSKDVLKIRNNFEELVKARTSALLKAKEQLFNSRAQLLLALNTGRISIFNWNLSSEVIEYSRVSTSTEILTMKKLPVKVAKRLIYYKDRNEVLRKLAGYISGTENEFSVDFRIRKKNYEWSWIHIVGKIQGRNKSGFGTKMIGIIEDISDLKKKDAALQQSQKLEAVGQLAGGIAHDFNNMLQAISGYAEIIIESVKGQEDVIEMADLLIEATNQSKALIRQLLTFSRMNQEHRENFDINKQIEKSLKMVKRLLSSKVEIETHLDAPNPYIHADPGQIEQVFLNLCVNARDAMNNKGKITVTTSEIFIDNEFTRNHSWAKTGNYIKITVSDTGPGIKEEHLKSLFEPFFTTKEVGKGTGLGLSIVYGIIQKHEGLINVTSVFGEGATFEVFIPARQIFAELKSRTNFEVTEELEGDETVLLAEDAELVRNFAGRLLRKAGYKVIFAVDGQEAVDIFKQYQNKIDILVFDIVMPNKSGKEAYEEIKEIKPDIPVLFCSGYHEEILDSKLYSGFKGTFLPKPYNSKDLLKKIRELLKK